MARERWLWTCQECDAFGELPQLGVPLPHNCRRHLGPYATVALLLVEREVDGQVA